MKFGIPWPRLAYFVLYVGYISNINNNNSKIIVTTTAITTITITICSNPKPSSHFSMRIKHKSFLALVFRHCFQKAIRNICNIENCKEHRLPCSAFFLVLLWFWKIKSVSRVVRTPREWRPDLGELNRNNQNHFCFFC